MLVHDLRGPLTSVTVLCSLVVPADRGSREDLEDMLEEAGRMRRMLNDVLDICLHEVGQLRARKVEMPLQPLCNAVARGSKLNVWKTNPISLFLI